LGMGYGHIFDYSTSPHYSIRHFRFAEVKEFKY